MATTPLAVVPSTAMDLAGLTSATAAPSGADPRLGTAYDSVTLAAAAPVWFHPMKDGSTVMVNARTWSAATPVGGTPGIYSTYTETLTPSWTLIRNGVSVPVPTALGFKTVVTNPVVVAGCSRPPGLLWLLHTGTVNGTRAAIMQHWDIVANGSITLTGEEVLPSTATVVFDKGIEYATPYLNVYGTDATGKLYRIRKSWSRIGFNQTNPTAVFTPRGQTWEYYTGTGWSSSVEDLAPIQSDLTSAGPVSFGYYRTQIVMSTVVKSGTTYSGQFYSANVGRSWSPVGSPIALGDSSATTYLGGGVQLMSQLGANAALLDSGVNAAIPYVSTQKVSSGGHYSLVNSWGLYSVSLVG